MQQIWGDWTKEWSFCRIKYWLSGNYFVRIPQEHKFDEYIEQRHDEQSHDVSNSKDQQSLSLYEKFMLNVKSTTLIKHFFQPCAIGRTNGEYSKAYLLNTKQLLGITLFALTGGSFGLQECFKLGGPMLMLISFFFVPLLWTIPITLMTLEMTCMIPETGGHVLWVYRAFGPFWSYINGAFAFACSVLSNAMYPSLFLEYLSLLFPQNTNKLSPFNYAWSVFIKMLILIFATIINVIGIDIVGNISLILAFSIFGSFFVIYCMGIKYINFSWLALPISEKVNRGKFLATFLWNTSGFDMVGQCAAEVLTPSYSYPRAFTYGFLLLIGSNILPLLIASSILPSIEDWSIGTYVDIAKIIGGTSFKVWIGIVGMFSMLGLLLIRLCTNSRILYGMAQVDQMPAALTYLYPKFHTPVVAILVTSLCTIVLSFFNFYYLVEASMLFYALSTILKFSALIQLRYTEPDVLRPYQIPFENNILNLFTCFPISMCIVILVYASEHSQGIALIGAAIVVFSYIGKEYFAQYGIKEVAEKRLVRVRENLERMQKRIDVVIESEIKVLESSKVNVALKNWTSRAKIKAKIRGATPSKN